MSSSAICAHFCTAPNSNRYQKICSNEKSSAYSSKIALPQLIESQDKKITAKEKRKFISYPLRSCNSVPKPLTLTIAPKSKQNKVQSS